MKCIYYITLMILLGFAVGSLSPNVPASIGQSALAIALYALLYIAIWQIVVQSMITALLLKFRKSEHLPAVVSFAISAGVFLFVIGLLILMLIIPENTIPIIAVLTFFMAPWVGATLIMRLKRSLRPAANFAILSIFLILISGWVWAYTIDNRVEHFFGKGSVLAEIANERLRIPRGNLIFDPDPGAWQIADVFSSRDYRYCARLQFYTWMRIPTHVWTNCFGSVLLKTTFAPGGSDSLRPQDRVFRARGTANRTEVQGLEWQDGALTLTLNPYFPLTGLALEFIDDGDIILTLFPSDAATDSEAGTLTWAVPEQPWQDGASLTFRIRAERLPGDPAGP